MGMNVLVSTNDAYVMPLAVLLQSLFETNPGHHVVYLLCNDLSADNRSLLSGMAEAAGSELVAVEVAEDAFRGLPTKNYISRETYYRLLAAELLPADVSRVLWLDADMVVCGPLDELYERDMGSKAVVACPHGSLMRPQIAAGVAALGMEHPEAYFNAGMMLCNLDAWRALDVPGRIRAALSQPRELQFPGQDLTNLVFDGQVITEDWRRWDCMTHSILPEDVPELREVARIVHFVGRAKPWKFTDIPLGDVWMDFYQRSPFGTRPLRRTSLAMLRKLYERTGRLGELA